MNETMKDECNTQASATETGAKIDAARPDSGLTATHAVIAGALLLPNAMEQIQRLLAQTGY